MRPQHVASYLDAGSIAVFGLGAEAAGEPVAALSIKIEADAAFDLETTRREITPIIECIERQIAIKTVLSGQYFSRHGLL